MNKYILNGMDTPPPPPPTPVPTATAAPAAKSRKMIYAIILIVIIVVVGVVAAFMLMKPGGSGGLSANEIANAHSLQYSASYTAQGVTSDFTFYAKNIGTNNMMMKMEGTYAGQQVTMIVNGAQHKVWMNAMGQWIDYSDYFDTQWSSLSQSLNSTSSGLGDWNGSGDYNYNDPSGGYSVHVYNIRVNPDLADSMFVHS